MKQFQIWDIRDFCTQQETKWSSCRVGSEAEVLLVRGRLQVLEIVKTAFASRVASPTDLRKRVDTLLDRLAEVKCRRILEAKHEPLSQNSIGMLLQIHETVPQIWSLCSMRWRNTNKKYRQLFRVYHARDRFKASEALWRSSKRLEYYQEVAIIQVPLTEADSPEYVREFTRNEPQEWQQRPEVRWFAAKGCHRGISSEDVVVSLLSGESWMINGLRGMILATVGSGHPLVVRQALRGCELLIAEGSEQEEVRRFFSVLNIEPQLTDGRYKLDYSQFDLLRTLDLELVPPCSWYAEEK